MTLFCWTSIWDWYSSRICNSCLLYTSIRDIIKTKYPIIQGGMANIANGEFAAAISNAGGLGLIAAGGMKPDQLRENIDRARELTDKPFGVNIMLMHPQVDELMEIVIEKKVPVVTTGAGNPGKYRCV